MDSKAEITSVLNIFARCSLAMFLKTSWGATSPGVLEAKQIFDACDQNQAPGRSQHTGGLKGGLNPKMRPVRPSEENGDAEPARIDPGLNQGSWGTARIAMGIGQLVDPIAISCHRFP